jgi:hypothetical protein
MRVNRIDKSAFVELVHGRGDEFLQRIGEPEAFVVKAFFPEREILDFRRCVHRDGLESAPGWHALRESCPDYHRLHDNYPNAYVKQKLHAFYFHGWYAHNREIFDFFREIFELKNRLAGLPPDEFLRNTPADGWIARVNVHHYPRGGGYQAEHVDPVGRHAQIQTLVCASRFGVDYSSGGVYARATPESEPEPLDPYLAPGDLLVMSPGIPHGVAPVDPAQPYDWQSDNGRWMILPLVVASDTNTEAGKPVQLAGSARP